MSRSAWWSSGHRGAWDRGKLAAEAGFPEADCPYSQKGFRNAWRDGWRQGIANLEQPMLDSSLRVTSAAEQPDQRTEAYELKPGIAAD